MSCGAAVVHDDAGRVDAPARGPARRAARSHRRLHQRTLLGAQLRVLQLAAQQAVLADQKPGGDEAQEGRGTQTDQQIRRFPPGLLRLAQVDRVAARLQELEAGLRALGQLELFQILGVCAAPVLEIDGAPERQLVLQIPLDELVLLDEFGVEARRGRPRLSLDLREQFGRSWTAIL